MHLLRAPAHFKMHLLVALITESYEIVQAPRKSEAFHVSIAHSALYWYHVMYTAGGDAPASLTDWMLADD